MSESRERDGEGGKGWKMKRGRGGVKRFNKGREKGGGGREYGGRKCDGRKTGEKRQ